MVASSVSWAQLKFTWAESLSEGLYRSVWPMGRRYWFSIDISGTILKRSRTALVHRASCAPTTMQAIIYLCSWCVCDVTNCFKVLHFSPPHNNGLYPGSVAKTNPPSPAMLFVGLFYHSNGNEARVPCFAPCFCHIAKLSLSLKTTSNASFSCSNLCWKPTSTKSVTMLFSQEALQADQFCYYSFKVMKYSNN